MNLEPPVLHYLEVHSKMYFFEMNAAFYLEHCDCGITLKYDPTRPRGLHVLLYYGNTNSIYTDRRESREALKLGKAGNRRPFAKLSKSVSKPSVLQYGRTRTVAHRALNTQFIQASS